MTYRPEIDGMRAVAVLAVIVFHAIPGSLPGGYVGVDVFFVISGYLITSIISADHVSGVFSIASFYERRARRILPALFVVLLASTGMAWLWLLPAEMAQFGRSLIGVATFTSNQFFGSLGSYFDGVEDAPLLHAWSLSIEEQYYLAFPLLLGVLIRLLHARTGDFLFVLAVLAFVTAGLVPSDVTPGDTFYMLSTRAWELLLGSALGAQRLPQLPRVLREAGSALGLAAIAAAILTLDASVGYPSALSLLPTVGAAFVIACAQPDTVIGQLLAMRPLVGVGVISYSAYLWHQPVLAFARRVSPGALSATQALGLIFLTLTLAVVTWRFVETPARRLGAWTRRGVFVGAAAGSLAVICAGYLVRLDDGLMLRFSAGQQTLIRSAGLTWKQLLSVYDLGGCFIDYEQQVGHLLKRGCVPPTSSRARIVIFGDSEAAHLLHGARANAGSREVQQFTGASCRAFDHTANSPRCRDFFQTFVARVLPTLRTGDVLLIGSNWIHSERELGSSTFAAALASSFAKLAETPARVTVVTDTPEFIGNPLARIVSSRLPLDRPISLPSQDYRAARAIVMEAAGAAGFDIVDPSRRLCDTTNPLVCLVFDGVSPLFYDGGHLSPVGSELVMREAFGPTMTAPDLPSRTR